MREIAIKRAYDPPAPGDGMRVLVDRVWPRGVSRTKAAVDHWARDLAPSTALRTWFGHDPAKWEEFRTRYRGELEEKVDGLRSLADRCKGRPLTLVYSARDTEHNQAVVLREVLLGLEGSADRVAPEPSRGK